MTSRRSLTLGILVVCAAPLGCAEDRFYCNRALSCADASGTKTSASHDAAQSSTRGDDRDPTETDTAWDASDLLAPSTADGASAGGTYSAGTDANGPDGDSDDVNAESMDAGPGSRNEGDNDEERDAEHPFRAMRMLPTMMPRRR